MIILFIASVTCIAVFAGTAAAFGSSGFTPSNVEGRLARALPGTSHAGSDSAYLRRKYEWTVEYDNPVGSQRIVLNQNPVSFGELAAAETARTTAMLYRGSTIEVWTEDLTTGERIRVDAVRMESRRTA